MSQYQTLQDHEDNQIFTAQQNMDAISTLNRPIQISPANPVAKTIPSILAQGTSGPGPFTGANTSTGKRVTSTYGPASRGYTSLRFYGAGVY